MQASGICLHRLLTGRRPSSRLQGAQSSASQCFRRWQCCANNMRMPMEGGPGCPDRNWPDQQPTACWHTLPACDSPVSAVALKDGCSASSLTTSSPVYPLAPSTATRWVFLVDPFEPAMLGLLGACRGAQKHLLRPKKGCIERSGLGKD